VEAPETTAGRTARRGRYHRAEQARAEAHWWVECADPFGRCRAMNVVVQSGGRIVVVAPPGESAVLSAEQTRLLGTALAKAAATSPRDATPPPAPVPPAPASPEPVAPEPAVTKLTVTN
jgi:hypothetical protein